MKKSNPTRIAILACYFGRLPWYFQYFIHSCKYNPSIDFYLICDTRRLEVLPKNVTPILMTLADLNVLATKKLGFQTKITSGYKFSDFKPAYGFLFSEIIADYQFWGQCDIDIILGNLRAFFTENLLRRFDYFSVRHDFPTGCFSLFRNNSTVNNLFKRSKDYRMVFSSNKHFCFDECNNVHGLLTSGKSIFNVKTEIESFMHIVKRAERENGLRLHFDFICIEGATGRLKFDHGRLFYKSRFEVSLYHLILFKERFKPKRTPRVIPDIFNISPNQIYSKVRLAKGT